MEVVIQPDAKSASNLVAEFIAQELAARPNPVIGLATGRTMELVYARLVERHQAGDLNFSHCHTFNLDEYVGLAGNQRNSYRYYMDHHLFGQVNIDRRNTHLPDGVAANLDAECARYERLIKDGGAIHLQLLGIGVNGHIGFNEPLSAFDSRTRVISLSAATREQNSALFKSPEQVPQKAITMGMGTILESTGCILLATGAEKAEIIAAALEGPVTTKIPATALQKHGRCTVVLDVAAATQLKFQARKTRDD
jgi:glucosamine-6-phosphate deaminase